MDYKDYYAALGIDSGAPADEVKKAYRKLARKYHPDVSKEAGAETRFKEVAEAYEVLKDPEKRSPTTPCVRTWRADGRRDRVHRHRPAGTPALSSAVPARLTGPWTSTAISSTPCSALRGVERARRLTSVAKITMPESLSSWKTCTTARRAACRCGRRCWTVRGE